MSDECCYVVKDIVDGDYAVGACRHEASWVAQIGARRMTKAEARLFRGNWDPKRFRVFRLKPKSKPAPPIDPGAPMARIARLEDAVARLAAAIKHLAGER